MAEYKNQHFYPRSFLKKFSPDGDTVWLFDGNRQLSVPYKDQCQKDNFYTASQRKKTEELLETGERLLKNLIKNETLQKDEYR